MAGDQEHEDVSGLDEKQAPPVPRQLIPVGQPEPATDEDITDVGFQANEGEHYIVVSFANAPMPICKVCSNDWNQGNRLSEFASHMWDWHQLEFHPEKYEAFDPSAYPDRLS